jgi:pimeloyl-ACP methyl ester carboxylesterase
MGAGAAAWAAAERPELVSGLGLLGPFVRNPPTSRATAALFRVLMAPPWARLVWTAYLPSLSPGRKPEDFAEHRRAISDSLRRPGYARAFSRTTRTTHAPVEARLGDVRTPTLVVMGERDPDFRDPAAEARWIGERLSAQVVLVPDAGHYPQVERPDVVNPALVEFCASVAPRA